MKYTLTFIVLSFLFCGYLHAQKIELYHDTKVYYDLLTQIEQLEQSEHVIGLRGVSIYFETSKKLLSEPWFSSRNKSAKLWHVDQQTDKDWQSLLDKIGVEKLKDQKLTASIGNHQLTKVHFRLDGYEPATAFLTLSPIIYSDDKTLALCVISGWYGIEDSSESAYILELKNGSWILIRSQLLGFE